MHLEIDYRSMFYETQEYMESIWKEFNESEITNPSHAGKFQSNDERHIYGANAISLFAELTTYRCIQTQTPNYIFAQLAI